LKISSLADVYRGKKKKSSLAKVSVSIAIEQLQKQKLSPISGCGGGEGRCPMTHAEVDARWKSSWKTAYFQIRTIQAEGDQEPGVGEKMR